MEEPVRYTYTANRCIVFANFRLIQYYDEEWICELGQSFENAIWGGVIERRPINGVVKGRSSGYCSHLVLLGHPGILTASNTDDDQMEKLGWAAAFYEDFDVFLVPTFWVSACMPSCPFLICLFAWSMLPKNPREGSTLPGLYLGSC